MFFISNININKVSAKIILLCCSIFYTSVFLPSNSYGLTPEKSEWYSCKENNDCAIIKGLCNWLAYSKNYKDEVTIAEFRDAHLRDCEESPDFSGSIPEAICNNNICVLDK